MLIFRAILYASNSTQCTLTTFTQADYADSADLTRWAPNMAVLSNYLLSSSAPVRFKATAALICLVQSLLFFSVPRTAGVTHWKLQDNAITPAATDLSAGGQAQQDDLFAMSLSSTDPEFAVLLRHATKVPATGAGNRGTMRSGSPSPRACPVVSITMDGEEVESRQGCGTGGAKKSTVSSDTSAGSCGRQCGCQGNVNSGSGSCGGRSGGGHVTVETSGETRGTVTTKQPRNPDGSGPM